MKLFKVKTPALVGNLHTTVSLSEGTLSVMDICPAPQSDEPLGADEVLVGGVRFSVLAKSSVNVSSAIQSAGAHTVLSLFKEEQSSPQTGPVDVFSKTINGRVPMVEFTRGTKRIAAHIFVPFSGAAVADCSLVVPESVDGELDVSGLDVQARQFSSFEQAVDALLPSLEIVGLSTSNGLISAQTRLIDEAGAVVDKSATVFIESTAGVVLTPRVELSGGVGQVIVSVAGLPSGIQGRIKAGFRYYPGKTEATFQI